MKKLNLNPDIDWIIGALKNRESGQIFIDLQTGEIIHFSKYHETTDLDPEEIQFNDRYLQIPDLCDVSGDMQNFINSIEDPIIRSQVKTAFYTGGRGRIRRVKEIVGEDFNNFEDEQIKQRFKNWLKIEKIQIIDNTNVLQNIAFYETNATSNQIQPDIAESKKYNNFIDIIDSFEPDNIQDARKKIATSITLRQGQSKFRQQLLTAYNSQCAISGSDIDQALEAAHIIPYLGSDTNHPSNGLLLRADLHTLFDLNLIAIHPEEMTVLIAPSLYGKYCEEFSNKKIYIPDNPTYAPSKKALKKRYEQCDWLK